VVDGNVYRVLSRIFGIETPIDSTPGKKQFAQLAGELLDNNQPGNYNQAIMDFGATHCLPRQPKCTICPFHENCFALKNNTINTLPVKAKKIEKKTRFFNFLILHFEEKIFIEKRTKKDIWQNLYQFPLVETTHLLETKAELLQEKSIQEIINPNHTKIVKASKPFKQTLTHLYVIGKFWEIELQENPKEIFENLISVKRKNLSKFAFPKIIDWYLKDKSLTLELL